MARMLNASVVVIVVILLFYFGGLINDTLTPTGYVLNNLKDPSTFQNSTFWITILLVTSLFVTAGVVIGSIFTNQTIDVLLYSVVGYIIAGVFISMAGDIVLIFLKLNEINSMIAVLIGSPLLFAWGMTIYDWVRGRD